MKFKVKNLSFLFLFTYVLLSSSSSERGNWSLYGSEYTWIKLSKADTDYFFHGPHSKFLSEEIWAAQLGEAIYLWPISYHQWGRDTMCKHVARSPEEYGRGDILPAINYRDPYQLQSKINH